MEQEEGEENHNASWRAFCPAAFLKNLVHNLHTCTKDNLIGDTELRVKGGMCAYVAIVLRVRPDRKDHIFNSQLFNASVAPPDPDSLESIFAFIDSTWVKAGVVEILFIRRTLQPTDKFSGQVAFPGGKQEPGEERAEAAMREAKEEVGLEVADRKQFVLLGKLHDRYFNRLDSQAEVSAFVFLQVTPADLPIRIQHSEVQSAHWIPIFPTFADVHYCPIVHPIQDSFVHYGKLGRLLHRIGITHMAYQQILIRAPTSPSSPSPSSLRPSSILRQGDFRYSRADKQLDSNKKDNEAVLCLWGLTMGFTLEVLLLGGYNALPYELLRSRNLLPSQPSPHATVELNGEKRIEETKDIDYFFNIDQRYYTTEYYHQVANLLLPFVHVPQLRAPSWFVQRIGSFLWWLVINDDTHPPQWRIFYVLASVLGLPVVCLLVWTLWRRRAKGNNKRSDGARL